MHRVTAVRDLLDSGDLLVEDQEYMVLTTKARAENVQLHVLHTVESRHLRQEDAYEPHDGTGNFW